MKNTINQLFNYHFEKDTQDKNNTVGSVIKLKGLDYGATPEQSDLAIHFKSIKKRYSVSMDYFTTEDFVQEYAGLFLFVAQELEVLEDLDYLLANPDVYKQRIRFIKDSIAREMYHVANPDKQRVYTRDGYKYIDNSATSLDTPVGQGEEATTLVNLISDENSIFKQTESHHNHFVQHFLDNREQILTKKQLTTFETLKDIYKPKAGNTKEDNAQRQLMLQDANLNNRNMKLIFKRIKDRVTDAYEKEFDGVYHSHSYTDRKGLYEVMAEYIESADYPGWNTAQERQRELNGIIQDYYNVYEELELTITKGLSSEEKKEIVRGVIGITLISHKVLRKVNNNIKAEISNHKPLMIEASYPSFDYNENPFAGLSKLHESNLVITTSGTVTVKDNLQTS
ncbi:hypothetical protein [Staphylococcus xylosus]